MQSRTTSKGLRVRVRVRIRVTHDFERPEHNRGTGYGLTNLHTGVSPSVSRIFCGLRSRWISGGVRECRWATASAQFVAHRIFVETGMTACPNIQFKWIIVVLPNK